MKDLFSEQSEAYSLYRPGYPEELFRYIYGFVEDFDRAWDCATGNGQAAVILAEKFSHVDASDLSRAQLEHAIRRPNISYHLCPAEKTPFPAASFDLITIATAYHWLDWDAFYREATRTGKHHAVVAAWSYNLLICDDIEINRIIHHFYRNITAPYWDERRVHVDDSYRNVAFAFEPLPEKDFEMEIRWNREQLQGFFSSWSAVQTFTRQHGVSPLERIRQDLENAWDETSSKTFRFPLFLRLGRIRKN